MWVEGVWYAGREINGKYKGAGKRDELCEGTAAGMANCCVCIYRDLSI